MATASRDKLTLGACALCAGLVLGIYLLFPIWAPSWMAEFRTGRSAVMLIYSAAGIVMTLAMPVAGWLLTRMPAWQVIVAGAITMGGGAIVASMIQTFLAFAIVYALLLGTGAALAGVLPCQSLAIRLFPRHVGKISGLMMIAMAITGVVLPLVVTPFMLAVGWRTTLAVAGAFVLVFIPLLAIRFMRERVPVASADTADLAAEVPAAASGLMRTRAFRIILGGIFPIMATSTAIQANLLPILADHGVGPSDASYILSGMAVGGALGAGLFGWLADRADPRLVLGGAAGMMAGSLLAFAGSGGMVIAASATVVLGVAGASILPLLSIFAFRQFGAAYAPAVGLLNSCMLPYMFAPPLIGLVRDTTGSYAAAFIGAVPLLAMSAAVVWLLRAAPVTQGADPLAQPAE